MLVALVLSAVLAQASPQLTVYVFTTTDCPISNRYAPEIQRLAAKYGPKVSFTLVYPAPSDSLAKIREHKKQFGYSLPSMRDSQQVMVRQTGVTVTPEVAVMRGDELLYRGRIDDRYVEFGRDRVQPTTRDLEDALAAVVAAKPVTHKQTRAIGCIISDLVK
jgi:hypothetical protein